LHLLVSLAPMCYSWAGDKALREFQEANISQQCFPILLDCAKQVFFPPNCIMPFEFDTPFTFFSPFALFINLICCRLSKLQQIRKQRALI